MTTYNIEFKCTVKSQYNETFRWSKVPLVKSNFLMLKSLIKEAYDYKSGPKEKSYRYSH